MRSLAERKRLLVAETDQLRLHAQARFRGVAHKLQRFERLQHFSALVRPVLVIGAAMVGYRRAFARSRLLRLARAGFALLRSGPRLLRRLRG